MRRLLILILALLTLASTAFAGAAVRKIVLKDGSVVQGEVVERGEHHMVVRTAEGSQIEVFLEQVERIEVIGEVVPAPRDDYEGPRGESDEYDIPRAGDWDDEEEVEEEVLAMLQSLDRRQLKLLDDRLEEAHALAVAPTIPTMIGGMVMMAFAPVFGDTAAHGILFTMGTSLVGGSVTSAAVGAGIANDMLGRLEPTPAYRVGLSMAIAGSATYSLTLGMTHAQMLGVIPSDGTFYYTALPVLIGSGIGLLIAGNTILMADAKMSSKVVSDRLRYRRRSAREPMRPSLAGAWVMPSHEGGVNAGFALSF